MKISRLAEFESKLGEALPADYREYLATNEAVSESDLSIEFDDRELDVRTIYALNEGDPDEQVDQLYDRIGRVLPLGSFPIASDWGGDMLLMFLPSFARHGVFYWSHEREEGDASVEEVASSLGSFLERLSLSTTNE